MSADSPDKTQESKAPDCSAMGEGDRSSLTEAALPSVEGNRIVQESRSSNAALPEGFPKLAIDGDKNSGRGTFCKDNAGSATKADASLAKSGNESGTSLPDSLPSNETSDPSDRTKPAKAVDAVDETAADSDKSGTSLEIRNGNKTGKASKEFEEKVSKMFNELPEDVKKELKARNVKLVVAPGFEGEKGSRDLGSYDPKNNTITISESGHKGHPPERLAPTAYHEAAHALDESRKTGKYESDSKEFRAAVDKDRKGMDKQTKQKLEHYTQAGDAGYEESYAEAFAFRQLERIGKPASTADTRHFQNALDYMRKKYP